MVFLIIYQSDSSTHWYWLCTWLDCEDTATKADMRSNRVNNNAHRDHQNLCSGHSRSHQSPPSLLTYLTQMSFGIGNGMRKPGGIVISCICLAFGNTDKESSHNLTFI